MNFRLLLLFCLGILVVNVVSGESCGGILEGDGGRVSFDEIEGGSQCIWLIKLLTGTNHRFQLGTIGLGSTLNLYPDHNPSDTVLHPISLTYLNSSTTVETSGQVLLLILVQDKETSDGLSFSWDSITNGGSAEQGAHFVSTNYVEKSKGDVTWTRFNDRENLVWALNLDGGQEGQSVILSADVQFESCQLINPCDCSSFGAYEILGNGLLREIYRVCGRPLKFEETGLSTKMVAFVYINWAVERSSLMEEVEGVTNSVQLKWTYDDHDSPTTTTTTTTFGPPTDDTTLEDTETTTGGPKPFSCPPEDTMTPCTCEEITHYISCSGSLVTHSTIDRVMTTLREHNDLSADDWLKISRMTISTTNLLKLNLTSLYRIQLSSVFILNNEYLTQLLMDEDNFQNLIDAVEVRVEGNEITNEGLGNFFHLFLPDTLTTVSLYQNKITGGQFNLTDGSGDIEYLPGFSRLRQLRDLYLHDVVDRTTRIDGGQFKRNRNLRSIYMRNSSVELGRNAFELEEPDEPFQNDLLLINLQGNDLTEADLDVEFSGASFGHTRRPTEVDLDRNRFKYFAQNYFESFLLQNEFNIISAKYNYFFCNDTMKWLKDGREMYEHRVLGLTCTNDPDHTVFTTDLIS